MVNHIDILYYTGGKRTHKPKWHTIRKVETTDKKKVPSYMLYYSPWTKINTKSLLIKKKDFYAVKESARINIIYITYIIVCLEDINQYILNKITE